MGYLMGIGIGMALFAYVLAWAHIFSGNDGFNLREDISALETRVAELEATP